MAVYFANKIPRQPGACTATSWSGHAATSARAPAMCAVAYSSGSVGVYTEEGDDVTATRPVRSDVPGVYPCALAWHPSSPLLAIGWTDGKVATWSGTELRVVGEETSTHAGRSITCIAWSSTGHRVVTGDDAGKTQVWTVDEKLRPKPTGFRCAKPAPGARTSHVLIPNDTAVDEDTGAEPAQFVFYYAVNEGLADSGYVCVGMDTAVDAGGGESKAESKATASRKIFDSPTAIHAALYHDGVGNLVTLGTDSVLSIFAPPKGDSIGGGGPEGTQSKWTVVSSTKLPTEGDAELAWTEPGVLAVVNDRDPSCAVRMFDLNNGDNYVLVPPARRKSQGLPKGSDGRDTAGGDPTGRRLSCLCYDADAKTLACGQRDGRVVMFRRTPPRGRAGGRAGGGTGGGGDSPGGDSPGGDSPPEDDSAPEDAWRVCASLDAGGTLERVHFASGRGARLLVAVCRDGARLCVRVKLNDKTRGGISVVQVAADSVVVEATDGSRAPARLNTTERGMQILGADATSRHLLVWNSARAEVHEARGSGFARTSAFDWSGRGSIGRERSGLGGRGQSNAPASSSQAMAIHGERIYRACPGRAVVEVTDLGGDVVDALAYEEAQGAAEFVDCNGDFLCAATASGHLRFWRLPADGVGRAEAHGPKGGAMIPADICGGAHAPGSGPDGDDGDVPEFSGRLPFAIDSVRVNCDGTKASVLFAHRGHHSVLSTLAVYDVDTDGYRTFDFAITGRAPESHAWDAAAPNVLAAQTAFDENFFADEETIHETAKDDNSKNEGDSGDLGLNPNPYASETGHGRSAATMRRHASVRGVVVFTLFASPRGLLPQEAHPVPDGFESLLGLAAPSLFVCNKAAAQGGGGACFAVTMRDFVGMEHLDATAKAALLTFNYDLAVGDVDRARALVKATTEPSVWEAMAHMCIKNKRLDVAETCLANLGHVRGGRAVRDGASEPELDARVGNVAVHLGLVDDAIALYEQCHRHDLLNRLYQAMGRWDDAIRTATQKDRINLKSTHYAHGRHLESVGDVPGAIRAYEKSGCADVDVPRMLHGRGMTDTLERYVINAGSNELTRWWARYCESAGDYEKALHGYQAAGDYLSLVRTYCAQGDLEIAAQLVEESGDPAAAFHLARTFEAMDEYADAIRFFGAAGRHGHAARLARRCGMDNELMHLALQSPPEMMLDSARYLEERGEFEKATTLYHKAGNAGKALELCFAHDLFDLLAGIVAAVADDTDADPKLVAKCASYFLDNGRYGDAARLLVKGGDVVRGLELIVEHDVKIDEALAEALTPPKSADPKEDGGISEEARKATLMKIAAVCKNQGSYHLACKKYTQAGDKMKAMKALLKSGDTEKICFFAGVSRQREIYVMSANYLQTLRWHGDPELTKHIVQFYTKARAVESLSGFYESVAQIEIDEYRDYDKAADALRDAAKHLAKSKADGHDALMRSLEARTELVETFVRARTLLAAGDVAEATRLCEQMIADPRARDESEVTIRVGDVYAMLVEHWYQARDLKRCRGLVAEMREAAGLAAEPYLEATMLAEIDGGATGAKGGDRKGLGSRREDGFEATSPTEEEGYLHGADDDADGEFYMDEEVHSDDDGA